MTEQKKRVAWNKGLRNIYSKEQIDRMSISRKNGIKEGRIIVWNKGRKGMQKNHNIEGLKLGWGWNKGKKNKKLSLRNSISEYRMIGNKHWNWKGGITYKNYNCKICNSNLNTSPYCMENHFKRFHPRNKPREKMEKGKWNWSCNYHKLKEKRKDEKGALK